MVYYFLKGGPFMYPILAIFIIGLIFVVERLIHLIKSIATKESFAEKIASDLQSGDIENAATKAEEASGSVVSLCKVAVEEVDSNTEQVEKSLDQTGTIEMASLEKNMTWISLSIAIAPMFGFLGTVWGMIQAFNDIEAANDISPAVVAGGISVALLTTAFGLVVALILQFLQNLVMYIIDNQIVTMQKSTSMLLKSITDKS